ncbi:AraC family transcriptional regulator [Spirosoma jeollabukense]
MHPLISLIDNSDNQLSFHDPRPYHVQHFYKIALATKAGGKLKYGQGHYDFDAGSMLFVAPNQLIGSVSGQEDYSGYVLFLHPTFLQGFPMAKTIRQYGYFSYSANEALHLSEREKTIILSVYKLIQDELSSRIDEYSHPVLIAQLELLLTYADRFYKRQFLTRKSADSNLLQQVEQLLDAYFSSEVSVNQGIPTVKFLAAQLNYSPNYLSDMLRSLTGQNAQQHIHFKLIEKAKEKLTATNLSVSEVAYRLGFEHSQSFNKLFKIKTGFSPLAFKKSFTQN